MPLYSAVMSIPTTGFKAYGYTMLYSPSCLQFLSKDVNGILDIQQCCELMGYVTVISTEKLRSLKAGTIITYHWVLRKVEALWEDMKIKDR